MKQFRNIPEILGAPDPVRRYIGKVIGSAKKPFEEALGGNVFLVEEWNDLKEVTIDYFSGANALETAGQLDIAEWADEDKTFAFFFSATNESGGPGYFVPAHLMNGNLLETINLSTKPKRSKRKT
jgi:hypothetical protein